MRLQPGVLRFLRTLQPSANVLELGCGNGELLLELIRRGHRGEYVGLDFSEKLLSIARSRVPEHFAGSLIQRDLADPNWAAGLNGPFDVVLAFAVLHHLPGEELRRRVIEQVYHLLVPRGRFVHSNWQFLNSPRLRARVLPWERVELSPKEVDPGDYLLDWRRGGYGLRYVHHFTVEELKKLAMEMGFVVEESYHSDGEGGRLGLYQVWVRK
jgi:SAM-dependent methyltransferase